MRWLSAGESHGQALVGIIDEVPSGISIQTADISAALARRRLGYGRGSRQKWEQDKVRFTGGVRHGLTTGAPIGIIIENSEWSKWAVVMNPDPQDPQDLLVDAGKGDSREIARNRPLRKPRPGHADLAGMAAYDLDDIRPVLERASARETAMRVALGEVAEQILKQGFGVRLVSHVREIGGVRAGNTWPKPTDVTALDADPVRTLDKAASRAMQMRIDEAKKNGDTLGGVVEVLAYGVPLGLAGTHVQWDRRLDAKLSGALMSIQSVKAVEIGDGMAIAAVPGSTAHDQIFPKIVRKTNHAGGIEGGISNGEIIRVRVAMKPISTVPKALQTVDLQTGEASRAIHQRSDVCAVVPGAVIAQAMVALTLADALLDHAGGYSLAQIRQNVGAYKSALAERGMA
ncbi:MAG: chorismate synthase [Actinomycetaceae bacterium]|nr:chorismate synthase [Actinomycetaceae bacterium]